MSEMEASKIEFAAIVFWDFVLESEEDELISTLEEIYGDEIDEYGGKYMGGGGSWYHRVAGNKENDLECELEFSSARTIVESNVDGILDVTTFVTLTPNQINAIVDGDYRSELRSLQSEASKALESLPILSDHSNTGHRGAFYAEWDGQALLPEEGEIDVGTLGNRLREVHSVLSSFGFQLAGSASLVMGRHFVSPTSAMNPYQGLSIIRSTPHPESGPLEEPRIPPTWYQEFSFLQRYYRLHAWGDHRWGMLQEFDSEADNGREAIASLTTGEIDVKEVIPVAERIHDLQVSYTDFRTRYDAEYKSLKDGFSERADEGTNRFRVPLDIPLHSPDEPEFVEESDQPRSIIEYFENNSEHTFKQLDGLYNRISEKIHSLVSSIESQTQLAATDENLQLQDNVTKLTKVLTGLTVMLVILTIILVGIELI